MEKNISLLQWETLWKQPSRLPPRSVVRMWRWGWKLSREPKVCMMAMILGMRSLRIAARLRQTQNREETTNFYLFQETLILKAVFCIQDIYQCQIHIKNYHLNTKIDCPSIFVFNFFCFLLRLKFSKIFIHHATQIRRPKIYWGR